MIDTNPNDNSNNTNDTSNNTHINSDNTHTNSNYYDNNNNDNILSLNVFKKRRKKVKVEIPKKNHLLYEVWILRSKSLPNITST